MTPTSDIDWRVDRPLDPALRFDGAPPAGPPRSVFLTGATGLLGAFVLRDLLRSTDVDVHCLVRGEAGAARLSAHLSGLRLDVAASSGRIVVWEGDLARPRLGLDDGRFAALAGHVDAIVHAGASVHFVRPYAALRATNVLGTGEMLRLAATGSPKSVHHISTLAVCFGPGQVSELDPTDVPPATGNGYVRSKWVAEQIVRAASERGLSASIYRPGRITGDSRTGATCGVDDLLSALIKASVLLGAYPALEFDAAMLPVDHVSRTIVHLVARPTCAGRTFNLFHPQPVAWPRLVGMIAALGYPMLAEEYDAWRARLKRTAESPHPERAALARLWILLGSEHSLLAARPRHETPNSQECLAGSGIVCPRIDEALVANYVGFFQRSGHLPPPSRPPT